MKIIGAILIVLGIAALAYKGFNYKSEETVLQIGSVKATAETEKSVPIPTWAGIAAIVVQFGLATMPFFASAIACGLTSLTTSGTSGSMRQALELSMTSAPASANRGACAREPVACLLYTSPSPRDS